MLLQNRLLAKTLGWLLPICVVAIFTACLNNCSHDESATDAILAYQSSDVLSGLDECEGCPITALKVVLAQRQSSSHAVMDNNLEQSLGKSSVTASSRSNELIKPSYKFISSSDPPLERFCVFRI
jgi:hypothetical protein